MWWPAVDVRGPAFASRVGPTARGLPPYVVGIAPAPAPPTRRLIELITQLGRRLGVEPAPAFATQHAIDASITTHTYEGVAFRGADRRRFVAVADSHVVQRPMSGPFPDLESTAASKSSS